MNKEMKECLTQIKNLEEGKKKFADIMAEHVRKTGKLTKNFSADLEDWNTAIRHVKIEFLFEKSLYDLENKEVDEDGKKRD